jgi:hypothetical protein
MEKHSVPSNMVAVSAEEFFARLKADQRDIMPSLEASPCYTNWETRNREVWGWSYPGWKNPGEPKIYAVRAK